MNIRVTPDNTFIGPLDYVGRGADDRLFDLIFGEAKDDLDEMVLAAVRQQETVRDSNPEIHFFLSVYCAVRNFITEAGYEVVKKPVVLPAKNQDPPPRSS